MINIKNKKFNIGIIIYYIHKNCKYIAIKEKLNKALNILIIIEK